MKYRNIYGGLLLLLGTGGLLLLVSDILIVPRFLEKSLSRQQLLVGVTAIPHQELHGEQINSLGFTGDEITAGNASSESIRIVTLGGSTMFLRNMTQKVKSELSDLFPNHTIEVLGAALPTHDSWLSTIKYDYLRGKVKADYVVIYHGINDLWANNVPSHEYFRDDYAYISPFHRRSWVLDHSLIARHTYKTAWNLERWLWKKTGRVFHIFNGASYETVRTLTNNVASIIRKAREDGAEPILMTFAWHLADGYTEENFVARELGYVADQVPDGCCGVNVWGPVEYVTEGLVRHNEALRTLGRSENVTMIDQHSLLSLEIANFQDICHFSELGAQRFARNLAEAIATRHTQRMSANQARSISNRT